MGLLLVAATLCGEGARAGDSVARIIVCRSSERQASSAFSAAAAPPHSIAREARSRTSLTRASRRIASIGRSLLFPSLLFHTHFPSVNSTHRIQWGRGGDAEHTWTGGRETGAAREPPSGKVPGPCALRRYQPCERAQGRCEIYEIFSRRRVYIYMYMPN